jgi:uncharacterized protein YeaO (DUF488 family)
MKLYTKRIYAAAAKADGTRILIDRLWPRGVSKEAAQIDYWAKSVAPSSELRRWFDHDPAKWDDFRARYFAELDANVEGMASLRAELGSGTTTILFGSKEERFNNASALREYLETHD